MTWLNRIFIILSHYVWPPLKKEWFYGSAIFNIRVKSSGISTTNYSSIRQLKKHIKSSLSISPKTNLSICTRGYNWFSLGFDWIWDHIPGLSWYQVFVVTIAGYVGTIGGFTAVYPNFAQYDTPGRCPTPLDGDSYSHLNLTFDQIVNITKTKVSDTTCQYVKVDYRLVFNLVNRRPVLF